MTRIYLFFAGLWAWLRGKALPNDYSLIDDFVYQGGAIDDIPSNIEAVLSLLAEREDRFRRPGVVPNFAYCWMPILDRAPAPPIEWLDAAVDTIVAWRRADWPVLIHCMEGRSRSGMVDIAYHMKKNKWPLAKAWAFVKSKRSRTQPNPAFVRLLEQYENFLNGTVYKAPFEILF